MNCTQCGNERPDRAKFCPTCGAVVAQRCASCGAELTAAAKFCAECGAKAEGAPVPSKAPQAGEARKVVTILFADLIGSTSLHERLDAESTRHLMERYYRALRGATEAHGGTVVKLMGDGVMAAFGVPQVAEDDALRAVRAGFAMQKAFRALAHEQAAAMGELGLRVGINTGEVVVSADNTDVVGDPVNVAARLQAEAGDGEVVIGESTRRLVSALVTLEPLGSFALKGRAAAMNAYRVVSLERGASAAMAAFVGRDDELARVTAVYAAALAKPAARLAVVLGSPGLGKSRLVAELARRLGDAANVVTAHCDAAGGATFAPISEAIREFIGQGRLLNKKDTEGVRAAIDAVLPPSDPDRARIVTGISALLAGSPASPEETFFVIRRFLTALAQTKPVVLVVDDLHWAEPLLLDLVEHLIQWGSGVPLFVLVGARPELRAVRSSLATPGALVADVVTLSGLDAGAAMRLAASVIGASDLPATVAAKVLATSEGNPLFVGELVRMLVDEGAIERQGDRWIVGANLAALEMPPTIHALLAARIERLQPEDRTVLELASVVGRNFSRSAVAALLSRNGSELDTRLELLRRSELIERDTGWFLGEPVLRFHHVLIRDAAYRRLLKGARAELHAQLADWIEAQVGDAPEHDETIGRHLEQAHQHLSELGPLDAQARELGERASRRLAAAGRRALAGDDLPLAASLLGRAIDRLQGDDPARAELALDWCEALLSTGDVTASAGAIDELARFAAGEGAERQRLRAWHTCFTGQLAVLTEPQKLQPTADAVARAADEFATLSDSAGEAKAHFVHALALARLGKVGACEASLDRALAAARRADDRRRANTVLALAPLAALWGPSPVTRASGRCLDVVRVLRITQGAPAVEAVALSCQGVLEALRGRTDAARRMIASARKMVEELGITQRLLEADVSAGLVELLEGDAVAAERNLRGAYEGLRDLGLGIDAARAAALLARALLAQDRVAEAETLSHESEALAGDDLKAAIAWRGVRAEALAKRGEHGAAVELASKAVEMAAATDALLDHADARLALAAALRAAGRGREADAEESRAIDLWEAKGAVVMVQRAVQAAAPISPPVALTTGAARQGRVRRRLRANAATKNIARAGAAIVARDADGLKATLSEDLRVIHHPTGSTYGASGLVESWREFFEARGLVVSREVLATLGESLVLFRQVVENAGHDADGLSFGPMAGEFILVNEIDDHGQSVRSEVFASDHLRQATARFYERYAESLPEGSERTRAAGIARSHSVSMWDEPLDTARVMSVMAPSYVCVDHRSLATWSSQGRDEWLQHWRGQFDLAEGFSRRDDDILAFATAVNVTRQTYFGTSRVSDGYFENVFLALNVFDADGLFARLELFEPDREAEALARFDEIVAAEERSPARRRVRANAAVLSLERFDAALAARDAAAVAELFDEDLEVVHHPTVAKYGRREMLITWRSLMKAEHMDFRSEVLASLGDALALERHVLSFQGFREAHLADAGPSELEEISLIETDNGGRWRHVELFASDRLGDAANRLYERHAELLPEGPARTRAEGTARSVASHYHAATDPGRFAAALAPEIVAVDHRTVGWGTLNGRAAAVAAVCALLDLTDDVTWRYDEVLALSEHASLSRATQRGRSRESGGEWERVILSLRVHDADGLLARWEIFEAEQEAAALARLDALVAEPATATTPRLANAASRHLERFARSTAERDWESLADLFAPSLDFDDRRPLLRMQLPQESFLEQHRVLFDVPNARWTTTPLATRGEHLVLSRLLFQGDVDGGGGGLEIDHLVILQVDDDGRSDLVVLFEPADLDAAYAELDARFAQQS